MQRTTNFEDDLVIRASAVLLTFTKIGSEVFPNAVRAAADMSAALGTDLQSAIIQVGKSLNDPIKGITALSRAGVSFTQTQKDQIKALVQSNDLLSAQKMILAELKTEFAGAAEANSDALTRWGNAIKNFAESLAEASEDIVRRDTAGTPGARAQTLREQMQREMAQAEAAQTVRAVEAAHAQMQMQRQLERERLAQLPFSRLAATQARAAAIQGLGFRPPTPAVGGPGIGEFFQRAARRAQEFAPTRPGIARAIFGANQDFFEHFRRMAFFMDRPAAAAGRGANVVDRGGTPGLGSRFLGTGVGFDATTQTARNTGETVRKLDAVLREVRELNRKQPNVVGKI